MTYCGNQGYCQSAGYSNRSSYINNSTSYSQSAGYNSSGTYNSSNYSNAQNSAVFSSFSAELFLDPFRIKTQFIGKAEEIREYVEDAFKKLTGKTIPDDIIITVTTEEECKKNFNSSWDKSIAGFAINKIGISNSEIFIVNDELDKVMLVLGHEIGHLMSKPLNSIVDEEAKAYAFGHAWMETIKENNIAGIGHSINPNPAINGIHNIACDFVMHTISAGTSAINTFIQLTTGALSATRHVFCYN